MKQRQIKRIAVALAVSTLAGLLTGCGSANNAVPTAAVVSNGTTAGIAGCVPLTQPIGFSAQNMYMDSNTIRAGIIPNMDVITPGGGQFGTMTISTGGSSGPYQAPNNQLTITPDGSISMNVVGAVGQTTTNYGNGYSTGAQAATATGSIQLSMQKLGAVMATYGYSSMAGYAGYSGYSGYNTYGTTAMPTLQTTMTQLCATGIAISLSHNGYNLFGGRVYLYLNVPSAGLTGQTSALGAGHGTYLQF